MTSFVSANGFAVSAPIIHRATVAAEDCAIRLERIHVETEEEFTRETYRDYIREDERTTGGNK